MGTFVQGEEGLKFMMKSIKVPLDKEGVGLNFNKKANALKYEGRCGKPYKYVMPWKKCAKCGGQGHLAQNCRVKPQRQYFQKRSEGKTAYWNKKTPYQNGPNRSYRTQQHTYPTVVQQWIKKTDLNALYVLASNQGGPKPIWVPKG